MAAGRRWSRDELVMAMNLYCKIPFGKLHHTNPYIVQLAAALRRTPSSVSMKLCNFSSLDPLLQSRGIRGLSAASRRDREVWDEFNADWGQMVDESERLLSVHAPSLLTETAETETTPRAVKEMPGPYSGVIEGRAVVMVRRAQAFFRRSVLASYRSRCCITGNPLPELLTASHIMPWATFPEHRTNPHNGLCLARTQDAAFDRGLLTFDEDLRVVVSKQVTHFRKDESVVSSLLRFEGQKIMLPERFAPLPEFLEHHRNHIFQT